VGWTELNAGGAGAAAHAQLLLLLLLLLGVLRLVPPGLTPLLAGMLH